MDIVIGDFDPETRQVPVTFQHEGVTHVRTVNAVTDENGDYDSEATAERVDDVARGVAYKIELGVIVNREPAPEFDPAPEPDSED